MLFQNREHAARLLVEKLRPYYKGKNPLILGIPRGSVPMAKVIAEELGGELDIVLVHKLGYPGQPELAIGAIDENGSVVAGDYMLEIEPEYLEQEKLRQLEVLRQRRARYTPGRAAISPHGRIVIVVDDGVATGSTMTAALRAIRQQDPKRLIGAVAVASPMAARTLSHEADSMVCLKVPADFYAVGQFFKDFTQVTDEDVVAILQRHEAKIATMRYPDAHA
jgi:predicted phosphoribosyltransferase